MNVCKFMRVTAVSPVLTPRLSVTNGSSKIGKRENEKKENSWDRVMCLQPGNRESGCPTDPWTHLSPRSADPRALCASAVSRWTRSSSSAASSAVLPLYVACRKDNAGVGFKIIIKLRDHLPRLQSALERTKHGSVSKSGREKGGQGRGDAGGQV